MDSKADGPALMRWLELELALLPNTLSKQAFADRSGGKVSAANLSRWGSGTTEPSLPQMRDLADALRRPLTDILIAAKVLRTDEVGAHVLRHTVPWTPEHAVKADRELTDDDKKHIVEIITAFRQIRRCCQPA